MSRWQWLLAQLTRRLWVRATLIGILGVVAAGLAAVAERYIPWKVPGSIGANAVEGLLEIIASSMLAVTTFSLSVMTSAYGSATSNVTPRATRLMVEDQVTQNVLSTFIGSFLFSIVGIVVLKTGAYGDRGRVILFIVTVGVIALIVISLLRWIDHLTRLGRVGDTTRQVEEATREALAVRHQEPHLGGQPRNGAAPKPPADALQILARRVGYVQHVDVSALSESCEAMGAQLHVLTVPGTFVFPDVPLAWLSQAPADLADERLAALRGAFTIGVERSFDQDPRFGLAVMSEIASRALSPAINDAGTAIDVIGRNARLLGWWSRERRPQADDAPGPAAVRFPRVHVPALRTADLFEDAFMLLARDGAAHVEVQLRLHKALLALAHMGDEAFRAAARQQSRMALARAEQALTLEDDRVRVRRAAQAVADDRPGAEASVPDWV